MGPISKFSECGNDIEWDSIPKLISNHFLYLVRWVVERGRRLSLTALICETGVEICIFPNVLSFDGHQIGKAQVNHFAQILCVFKSQSFLNYKLNKNLRCMTLMMNLVHERKWPDIQKSEDLLMKSDNWWYLELPWLWPTIVSYSARLFLFLGILGYKWHSCLVCILILPSRTVKYPHN